MPHARSQNYSSLYRRNISAERAAMHSVASLVRGIVNFFSLTYNFAQGLRHTRHEFKEPVKLVVNEVFGSLGAIIKVK